MDIQLKLVLTQLVAFLIVLWILRKYAWDKLLGFMEKRRELIASQFEEIEHTKSEADKLREQFENELEKIDTTSRAKIQEAVSEANEISADIKEEARKEAVALRVKTNQDIEIELDKANVELRDRMVAAVITTTEKLIGERLDSDKHRQLITQFLDEVDLKGGRA